MVAASHEAVQDLIAKKHWSAALALLESAVAHADGIAKFRYLAQRCHVERGLSRIDLARASLAQAFDYAVAHNIALPTDELLHLVEQFERNGQIELAAEATGWLTNDARRSAMAERLAESLAIRQKTAQSRTRLIALGQNCLADHLAYRWGLARLTIDGPFTAAMFHGNGAAAAIEDGFGAFSDPSAYRMSRSIKGFAMATIPAYRAELNHQLGDDWLGAGTAKVEALYRRRLGNWRKALSTGPVLFVATRLSQASPARLWRAIKERLPSQVEARLVVFDFLGEKARGKTSHDDARVSIIPVAYPPGRYLWYLSKFYNSPAGIAFERPLVRTLAEEITALENPTESLRNPPFEAPNRLAQR